MSEANLSALAENDEDHVDKKEETPIKQIDNALRACEFGRYHIQLLLTTLTGFVAGVAVSNTTSYLLPSAECDLNMSLLQKGFLNAAPYSGMLFSSLVAGFLTDTFGRKIFIHIGYGGIFIFTVIGGSSQSYELLVTAKFFEGMLFAASFSACVTYTAEFCYNGIRDRILMVQSSFIGVAQILIAGLSWAILKQEWRYSLFNGSIVLNTWNFYLFIMSLWSLSAFLLYLLLPESPKYLVIQKKYSEAREILIRIYKINTGKSAETYPFKDIWKETKKITNGTNENLEVKATLSNQIVKGLHNIKPMFRRPLVIFLSMICTMNCITMSLYNVIRLWFPQVSTVVEHYASTNNQDLCVMLDAYAEDEKLRTYNVTNEECIPNKSGDETYTNSLIIGCFCLLSLIVSSILVNKVGKKVLIITAGVICCFSTLGIRFANSKVAVVVLFALDTSVSQAVMALNQAIIVESFPTTTRTLAISMMMMVGRIGTLVGNVTFPILLSMSCEIPFYTLFGCMISVVILAFFLPKKKKT
ncbi:synaptic vesicle glycoprotein 2A-like [Achroia grisella]|uniref:synaptic vesicle glycoprotein 2A-like n=1 Tax=Achroia grisella TaxID=688607 RepID=UPI0027D22C24|nr:synaptic vesicle glycoprotein 2A-like [Achroia grisella]